MKNDILVLMSTYNGEKYIEEQINSILNQKDVKVHLLVRDDGSTDNTINILEKYKKDNKLEWFKGGNLGPAKSFLDLLKKCQKYEYYAFSDQDDYWYEDKLSVAIKHIDGFKNKPALYFSNKEIVNSKLEHINCSEKNYVVSFETSMVRNIVTGCTLVINNKLRELINSYTPNYVSMHDSWIYRVCLALNGECYYDREPHIKYRQHDSNVIGANEKIIEKFKRRCKNFFQCKHDRSKTAKELLNGYSDLIDDSKKDFLNKLAYYNKGLKNRFSLFKNKKIKTESKEINTIFKVCLFINKL